ncbi:MAG: cytochrome c3 family protein [Thermodesulfobacteriota bacterium]
MVDREGKGCIAVGPGGRNRSWRGRRTLLGGVLLLSLLGVLAYRSVARTGEGQEICQNCHPDVYSDIASKPFVHRPEIEHKCSICHVAAGGASQPERLVAPDKPAKETNWVAKSLGRNREQWLKLGQGVAGQAVLVRVESEDGRVQQTVERVPELSRLSDSGDERVALAIDQPEVVSVQRGVLLTATIVWKTNKASDSAVHYGETGLGSATPVDGRLTRQHEVVLSGLKPGKTYRFAAVSTDAAGNTVRSQEMVFSTARPFSREAASGGGKGATQPLATEKRFYRGRGLVLLQVTASEPVAVMVGSTASAGERVGEPEREVRVGGRLPPRHPPMVDRYTLAVTVCLTCHPATKGVVSHPVNVYPKNGMVIPTDYPTLPDGRLSCMSCHVAHAGHYQYRIPRPTKKALCTGCHRNFR